MMLNELLINHELDMSAFLGDPYSIQHRTEVLEDAR